MFKNLGLASLFLIGIMILAGCQAGVGGGAIGTVICNVTNSATSEKIQGAVVTIGEVSVSTDSSGQASFSTVIVGSQSLTATKEGYIDYSGVVEVVANSTVTHNISMSPEAYSVAPTGLTATAESSSTVEVTWNAVSDSAFSGYNIYRSTSATGIFTKLNPSLLATNSYTNSNLTSNTTYYYKLTAVNNIGGESAYTDAASATTNSIAIPTGLAATAESSSTIEVTWNAVSDSDFSGYNIYRSASATGTFTKLNSSWLTTNSYTDSNLTSNTTYYYKVTAINSIGGEGAYTDAVSATTNSIVIPTGLSVTSGESTSTIEVTWAAVTNPDFSGYNVYRNTTTESTFTKLNSSALITNIYTDSSVEAGTTYYYKICALNAIGEEGAFSDTVLGYTLYNAPLLSANIPYKALNWTSSGANGSVYNIYRSLTSGSGFTKTDTREFSQAGVSYAYFDPEEETPGTTYYYKITIVDIYSNESDYSNEVSLTY